MTLPEHFTERMHALLRAEAEAFLTSLDQPARAGLRVNTLKCSPEAFRQLAPWPLEPVPWCASGFLLPEPARPGLHPLHRAGVYYLQEPSAMAVAAAVAPEPGDWVIDLAAAPGGKATHLASLMENRGLLVANEVTRGRVRALGENLERWGARHTVITQDSVARLAKWGAVFDRVLLDAPCSGEGMFRKSAEALSQWSNRLVESCAARQDGLLAEAAQLVRPGGVLVYSTCTFAPEEDEAVVAKFLQDTPEFRLEPLTLPGAQPGRPDWLGTTSEAKLERTARFWPHLSPGEGHFIAKLRRTDGPETRVKPAHVKPPMFAPPPRQAKLWETFVRETFAENPLINAPLTLQGDHLYALPETLPDLTGIHTLRTGLWLGTLKKNRFKPSHSLALALTPGELVGTRTLSLDPNSPEVTRYLGGDVLDAPGENGWLVVTVSGFALGWGRRSQGVVKNFYPKGLRR
ncbi:MAG: tRNA and rRNA cytosine-C5-methylases [uncultured Truepera sp.]|uniref:tRNA and rRNA cytosine-C5-methylases n=1 Tax=uncultured Truepera sp. TaxID=543023 RepID=A0A6J4VUK9_9DEIN|nr:MAG: tRNA and rRNA cytosine-C5-methylases [uncultured Truepera sp.]